MLVLRGSKTGGSVGKPTKQGREPTTTATDTYHQIQESNPGHSGGRLAFSPLRHPRSEIIAVRGKMIHFSLKHSRHVCP